ncbi:MAG TPA: hypothetical protein VFR69_14455 [Rubrobacteraceae bacterium]|nr:hypothetical protein [Rubrobacteraceae bacterium]
MAAGFVGFDITWRKDVFSGAPQAGSATSFGTLGINFRARKAANEEEWVAAMAALSCEIPIGAARLEAKRIAGSVPPPPENHDRIAESNRTGELPEGDATELEAGANRCAVG